MKTIYQGQEVRNSTESEYAIFYEGKELETSKSGAINSVGGIVLTATLPSGKGIKWRSNDNYGRKGFSFDDVNNRMDSSEPGLAALADRVINKILPDLRKKLEYKISN